VVASLVNYLDFCTHVSQGEPDNVYIYFVHIFVFCCILWHAVSSWILNSQQKHHIVQIFRYLTLDV